MLKKQINIIFIKNLGLYSLTLSNSKVRQKTKSRQGFLRKTLRNLCVTLRNNYDKLLPQSCAKKQRTAKVSFAQLCETFAKLCVITTISIYRKALFRKKAKTQNHQILSSIKK